MKFARGGAWEAVGSSRLLLMGVISVGVWTRYCLRCAVVVRFGEFVEGMGR